MGRAYGYVVHETYEYAATPQRHAAAIASLHTYLGILHTYRFPYAGSLAPGAPVACVWYLCYYVCYYCVWLVC